MKDKWKYQRIERDCSSLPIAVAIYALDHISSRPAAAEPDLAGPRRETARGVPNAEAGARRLPSHGCRRSRRRSVEARDYRSRLTPTSLRQGSHVLFDFSASLRLDNTDGCWESPSRERLT